MNKGLLEAIKKYQSCPFVHNLTCGNDSNHELLKGIEIKGKVVLICPDCEYVQNYVPDFVWLADEIENSIPHIFKELAE